VTETAPATATPEDRRAEFGAYRQEILARSGHQQALLALNLTAISGLAGFVLAQKADERLLLLLPIVCSAIGLLWYDHARNIESLGDYIRQEMPDFGGYEERIDALERSEWRRVPMTAALLVLFVATPIAGIIVPFDRVDGALWVLWAVGLVLSVSCIVALVGWMMAGLRPARPAPTSGP
jgi:hypothetical protein